VGQDVIIVHRMLKNSVPESVGTTAYAFLSEACVCSLGIERAGLREHTEHYADVGNVHGAVLDLAANADARPEVGPAGGDAQVLLSVEVAASTAETWAALTDPAQQLRWRVGATRIDSDRKPGLGTQTHCVHGKTTFTQEIVDWQPQHQFSYIPSARQSACCCGRCSSPHCPAAERR
jgi:hypothetical protein